MIEKQYSCILIGPAFPLRGGIANFNESLCEELNKEGIETKIISFSLQYPSFLFPGTTQYDINGKAPSFKIDTLINSINPFNWFKVARKIRKEAPDFIIVRYWLPFMAPCLGTILRLVRRNKKIKIIALTDNIIPHEKHVGHKFLTKYFVKQCHGFVAMSKSVLNDLSEFTKNNNKVFLPHPIYDIFGEKVSKIEAKDHLFLEQQTPYILFFGFIRKYKGLDLLLEAMSDERIKNLPVKLIVAGEFYEDSSHYDKLIQTNGLKDKLELRTEFINPDLVKHYFCAADLIVQPYRTATQSGVTQIAYHFERPMLVTNVGGLPEIVKDKFVGYVTELDKTSIADAIVDFYLNNREASYSENTREEKKKFQWINFIKGVQNLYKQL